MIIQGSLNHSLSGRKKKSIGKKGKSTYQMKREDLTRSTWSPPPPMAHTIRPEYPSAPPSIGQTPRIEREKSDKYTVAIAYNKGAYQVIPKDDIKHIGK